MPLKYEKTGDPIARWEWTQAFLKGKSGLNEFSEYVLYGVPEKEILTPERAEVESVLQEAGYEVRTNLYDYGAYIESVTKDGVELIPPVPAGSVEDLDAYLRSHLPKEIVSLLDDSFEDDG